MPEAPTPSGHPETAILIFPPLVHVIFGIVLEIVWVCASIMSMQTTEAWFLSIGNPSLKLDLSIFAQFPGFFDGSLAPSVYAAFVFAFSIQCVLLTAKIGLASVHARIARKHDVPATAQVLKSAKNRALVWNILSTSALILNGIADAVYSYSFGFFQSVAFCAVLFLVTFYLGTFGIQNITAGMSHMNQ